MNKIIKYLTLFFIFFSFPLAVYAEEREIDPNNDYASWFCCFPFGNSNYLPLDTEEIPLTPPPYQTSEIEEQKAIKVIMDQCYSVTYGSKIDSSFYSHSSRQGIAPHKQTLIVALSLGLLVDRPSLRDDPYSQFNGKTDFYHTSLRQAELNVPSEEFKQELLKIFQKSHAPTDNHLLTLDSFDQVSWQNLAAQVMAVYTCFPLRLSIMDIYAITASTNEYQGWKIVNGEAITPQFSDNVGGYCDYFNKQDEAGPRWKQTAQHKHVVAGPVTLYDITTCSKFSDLQANTGDLVIEYSMLNPLETGYEDSPLIFYLIKPKPERLILF